MDNEKKAKSLSYYHYTRGTCNGKECEGCEYAKADDAVLAMAEWKDQEFARQKQALIDKACLWLENEATKHVYFNEITGEPSLEWNFTELFRKAMEETL